MKFKKSDLEQINARKEVLKRRQGEVHLLNLEVQILQKESTAFNIKILKDYGLDPKKTYEIGKEGELTEVDTKVKENATTDKSTGGDKKSNK